MNASDIHGAVPGCESAEGPPWRVLVGGQWRDATAAEILAATKTARIEADRQECRRRLTEHYGDALEQASRFAGGYGAQGQANILEGTMEARRVSNVARDQINAATTLAQVEAVTVAWPVLP